MNRRAIIIAAVTIAIGGCSRHEAREAGTPTVYPERQAPFRPPPRPAPTIDPKSNEAAKELVEGFVRLLNAGRFNDAYMLLGPNAPPRPQFDERFKGYSSLSVSSGAAGLQEGAAGSIYVSVPLKVSGRLHGQQVDKDGTAVLRRVNDVPGSTEAQRRWHIERIDWKDN
jgi:hypothetical protein